MATMNVSLPDEMKRFVEGQVATGLYANVSDYVRDVIRARQRSQADLDALLEEGEASATSPLGPREIVEDVKRQWRAAGSPRNR